MGRNSDARERLLCAIRATLWEHGYGATTVDAICTRADVRKGSFYHFFDSKADLAVAALREDRPARRALLDRLFSPTLPPLERIRTYCTDLYSTQKRLHRDTGCVLGCPLFSLGAEVGPSEPALRRLVTELLADYLLYFASAIREAQERGELPPGDAEARARCLHAFIQGTLTHARIANDPALLRPLADRALAWLRLPDPAPGS
jgi:TetR/AcrR family transcriptional repressor of nem operon